MLFDDTDVIRADMFYKDLKYRVNGVDEDFNVFVDWGVSSCEDFVILGSPFQIRSDGMTVKGGVVDDAPVLYKRNRVDTSLPQHGQLEATLADAPIHFKPGINI